MPRRFCDSRRAWRSACWQVGGSVMPGVAWLGTAAQSPSDQMSRAPTTRRVSSTSTRPCSSTGSPSALTIGLAATPAVHTTVDGLDPAAVGEPDAVGVDDEARRVARDDLDAAPVQRALGKAGEAVGRLAEDPRPGVDQDPARADVGQARVAAQRLVGHLGDLGDRLDAGEAGARDDEGQPPRGGVRRGVGQLDLAQDVVAQADRIAEVLEPEGVLAQAGHGRGAGDGAERDHELLVGDRDAPRLGLHLDHAAVAIEHRRAARARDRRWGTWCAAARRRGGARCCPRPPRAAAACRA